MSDLDERVFSVTARFNYVDPTKPLGEAIAVKEKLTDDTVPYIAYDTVVRNARRVAGLTLQNSGFELVHHQTRVSDFFDQQQTETLYRKEMEDLVTSATGADKVIVFHMQPRDYGPEGHEGIRRPARTAHIDYDENTFRIRVREEMGDEADYWLEQDFAAINVWRGIRPVEEVPLAICDARTVVSADIHTIRINERPGEPTPYTSIHLSYSPDQIWYYYPDMQTHEALLIKLADTDHARPRWCGHSAFDDPTSRPDARPRASFEVRTIAFFKKNAVNRADG